MKTRPSILRIAPLFLSLCPLASAQEAPSLSGQLHLKFSDGKGKTTEMNLPKDAPLTIDLSGWQEMLAQSGGIERLTDSATKSLEMWAGDFARRLSANQSGKAAWLGVATQTLPETIAAQMPTLKGAGLLVRDAAPGSPAATVGLKPDDILVRINDQVLYTPEQLKKLLSGMESGATVELAWMRQGTEQKAQCNLSAQPPGGFVESVTSALLGGPAGKSLAKHLGPEGEKMISRILTDPKLLEEMPALKDLLTQDANGQLDTTGLKNMLEQAEKSAPELRFLAKEMVRTIQTEKDLTALAEKLKAQIEMLTPEAQQRSREMMQKLMERMKAGK
jgi:hypothetical protein